MSNRTCQQPNGCEGVSRLDAWELEAPALCILCQTVLCDVCAAWLDNIPTNKIPIKRFRENKRPEHDTCSGVLCSNCFVEDWV